MPKKDVWNVPPVVPKKAAQRMSEKVPSLSSLKTMTGRKRMVTPKHWKFITEYVSGDGRVTMKEAAIRAGYNEKSASGHYSARGGGYPAIPGRTGFEVQHVV
jgi:hypothetical protein